MFPKIAPGIPFLLAKVIDVSFLPSEWHVCVRAVQLESIFNIQVVYSGSVLNTISPKGKRVVRFFMSLRTASFVNPI